LEAIFNVEASARRLGARLDAASRGSMGAAEDVDFGGSPAGGSGRRSHAESDDDNAAGSAHRPAVRMARATIFEIGIVETMARTHTTPAGPPARARRAKENPMRCFLPGVVLLGVCLGGCELNPQPEPPGGDLTTTSSGGTGPTGTGTVTGASTSSTVVAGTGATTGGAGGSGSTGTGGAGGGGGGGPTVDAAAGDAAGEATTDAGDETDAKSETRDAGPSDGDASADHLVR
jgi:hypothetical protein